MNRIITFYSFKGGVGRSMALANIAVLLTRRGLRVLAVDWDLEAPGLERYFGYFESEVKRGGLLPLLVEQQARLVAVGEGHPERYRDHLQTFHVGGSQPLALLASGRAAHADYARILDQFSWSTFFAHGGGDFLERLRDLWRTEFDVVLIDSRTGMSDAGGICTIQMPDLLVVMFTANYQSMLGVRDVVASAQQGRQRLAYDRMALTVLPVASRFSTKCDGSIAAEWLDRFASELGPYVDDWLPRQVDRRSLFDRLKLPHDDAVAFGERLIVAEQGADSLGELRSAYARIAELLATDFQALDSLGLTGAEPRIKSVQPTVTSEGDDIDVFVSYPRAGSLVIEWAFRLVDAVRKELESELGRTVHFFVDLAEIQAGDPFPERLSQAIERSRVLLALLTPRYWATSFTLHEWQLFEEREARDGRSYIIPVALQGTSTYPKRVTERLLLDGSAEFPSTLVVNPAVPSLPMRVARAIAATLHSLRTTSPATHPADEQTKSGDFQKVLFLAANPVGSGSLELDVEVRELENELSSSVPAKRFQFQTKLMAEPKDLQGALASENFNIVHFSGHGTNDGLYFRGSDGLPTLVLADELKTTFQKFHDWVKLVVLSACYSAPQAAALSSEVDCVVGMAPSIAEDSARVFTTEFYAALAKGESVKTAVERGRDALPTQYREEPKLLTRSGVDAGDLIVAPREKV